MMQTRSMVRAVLALTLPAIGLLAAHAQGPADSPLQGFQRSGEYSLAVDGKPVPTAEIYLNDKVPALLILTSALPSPVMLTPRTGGVETVNLMKISRQKDGSVDLFAGAVLAPLGQFQTAGGNITFTVQGKKVSLAPRPALLGPKTNADLKAYLPEYVRGAGSYTPSAAAVADLRKKRSSAVTVRVFFGSWCPHCRQHVPLLLKVEDEVQNPRIRQDPHRSGGSRKIAGGAAVPRAARSPSNAASGSIPPLCQVASGDWSSPGAAKRESPSPARRGSSAQASSPAKAAP
jgi:thiol-disulfide isomerase/thioredoxin